MASIEKFDSSMIVIREPGVVLVPRQIPPPWRQTSRSISRQPHRGKRGHGGRRLSPVRSERSL